MNSQNIKTQKRSFLSSLLTTQKLLANFWGKLCFSKDPVRGETRTTVRASSINCSQFTAIATLLLLTACGTTNTTTTTKYDTEGNVTEITETVSDASDFAVFISSGDEKVTVTNLNFTKFVIGQSGVDYFNGSGTRITAPVKNEASSSATALKYSATLFESIKTSIESDWASINKTSTSTEADDSIAEEVENIEGEAEEEKEEEADSSTGAVETINNQNAFAP